MSSIKVIYPHFLAIVLFALITILYCHPILKGQKINQSDYKQFLGMSKEIVDYRSSTGEEALWTNSMFGGMPAYQISVRYPNNILVHIDQFFQLYLPRPIGVIFLYFLGFYIFLLSLKINPKISVLGAIAFGMSSYFFIILEAGHNTKAHAIAYMAPAVASMLYCIKQSQKSRWHNIAAFFFAFLALGLHLRANHLQITYYLLFILFSFWIYYLINFIQLQQLSKFIKSTLIFIVSGIMAISINLGSIWSTYDYSKHTIRGHSELKRENGESYSGLNKDYATAWSYGKVETFNMLYPNFVGGSSHAKLSDKSNLYQALQKNGISRKDSRNFIQAVPLYFGPQSFTSGPVYIGAIVWLLFFIGFFTIKKPIRWILLSLIVFSFLLAWGKYFPFVTNFFLDYFPLYNKFRTVSMILVITQFTIPLLAIIGFNQFVYSDLNYKIKMNILLKSSGILIGISLFFLLFSNLLFDFRGLTDSQFPVWFIDALILDRIDLFKMDIIRSLFFIIVTALLVFYFVIKTTHDNSYWLYGLIFLVLIDMWFVNKRYLNTDDFVPVSDIEKPFKAQIFDQMIKQDTSVYRVYNLTERIDQGARTSYFHHSLGGYHGAKLGKYQEVIDQHIIKGNMNVINMLNTKYIIVPSENGEPTVQQNTDAFGNAWFVDNVKWVETAKEEIGALSEFNLKKIAIVNEKYKKYADGIVLNMENSIQLISYAPNKIIYNVNNEENSLAVFSEIFYPEGWQAYIDGVAVNHFPVNYILRGLVVPRASKKIIFEFKPQSFFISAKISFLASCLLIITGLITFVRLVLLKK